MSRRIYTLQQLFGQIQSSQSSLSANTTAPVVLVTLSDIIWMAERWAISFTIPGSNTWGNLIYGANQWGIPYELAVVADNPVGFWTLDDAPGSTGAADSSGNGQTGSIPASVTMGVPGLVPGDTAALFPSITANSNRIACPISALGSTWSWECWALAPTNTSLAYHFLFTGPAGTELPGMYFNPSLDFVFYGGGGSVSVNQSVLNLVDGNPHHIVGTCDGTNIYLYIDGAFIASAAQPATLAAGTVYIGGVNDNWWGTIDQVAVYDYVLSATQVQTHYQAGQPS